ncbi:MAG: aspartate carbamoyltransferase [archaeon]
MEKTVKKEDFIGRDFVSIDDFSFDEINFVLNHAKHIEDNFQDYKDNLSRKLMAPLFFEGSTRTNTSFQAAMIHMNGRILDFDVSQSSVKKGEILRDTVKVIERYRPDIMVVRHNLDGSAILVADSVKVPVINAGDGKNQHPTQTLLDLYTIKQIRENINGTKIALIGDLKYGRTVHSLALALSGYSDCEIEFISPDSLKMPAYLLEKLKSKIKFSEYGLERLNNLNKEFNIIYMTRVQRERFPEGPEGKEEYDKVCKEYHLKKQMLKEVDSDFKILHPLPKVHEIEPEIDDMPYAYYFDQLGNGLYIRMALLDLLVKK